MEVASFSHRNSEKSSVNPGQRAYPLTEESVLVWAGLAISRTRANKE